jgi:hypothetical protein
MFIVKSGLQCKYLDLNDKLLFRYFLYHATETVISTSG